MNGKFTIDFEGRDYTVEGGERAAAAAKGGGAPAGRGQWYITLGPKAITSLEVRPGESDSALRERIRAWLAEHPEMPNTEDIVFGGG
ncbi:MAG: hypothetical protein H0W29_16965 [Gemmatimonadales bacterium]|nr:hypothetical protein [Gemmatimonadales bacterium]